MKTLEHIKNEYAKSKGYDDFNHLILDDIYSENIKEINNTFDELLTLVQKECLKNAEKNVYNANSWGGTMDITNENNIIR